VLVVVFHEQAQKTLLTSSRAGLPELVESSDTWGCCWTDDGRTVLLLSPMISRPGREDEFLIHDLDKVWLDQGFKLNGADATWLTDKYTVVDKQTRVF